VYFGSTVLVNFAYTTTQTGVWYVQAIITKTGSNAQTALTLPDQVIAGANTRLPVIASPTEADTAAIVIKATGQVSAGGANIVTCNMLSVAGYN
jgi:hypothetical protein